MPRKARELSPLEVGRLIKPGRWSVGGVDGLALQVTATGARSWVLRLSAAGRRHEMGLGSFPSVTLAAAREKARRNRSLADEGADPVAARRALRSAASAEQLAQRTFTEVAAQYIAQHEKSWKNAKHQAQWTATLRTYAEPSIGKLLVRDIRPAHVIGVLEPIWTTKTETATRVRSRIELVLDYAAAHGYRERLNPARWKGNLDAALPNASKVAPVRHHAEEPGQGHVADPVSPTRLHLFAQPRREDLVLRQVLAVGVDQDVDVGEDHAADPPRGSAVPGSPSSIRSRKPRLSARSTLGRAPPSP